MTRKEIMDLLLSKVPEEKKDAFVTEIRGAGTKEERNEILKNMAQCSRQRKQL